MKVAKESSNDTDKRCRTHFERHRFLIRLELETIPYIGGIRNDEKIPHKLLAVSAFLTITTTYAVIPLETFAIEIEQTNTENMSLSANEEQMKKALQDAGLFAKAMNEYSYLLINNPDVSFEGITINGNADLPSKIVQDQKNARAHAVTWNTQVKTAFDTLTGIIEYDTKFENYYETLVEAINTGNGDTLKKGLQIYREEFNKIKSLQKH